MSQFTRMQIVGAVVAALLTWVALGKIYVIVPVHPGAVYRINQLTGTVSICHPKLIEVRPMKPAEFSGQVMTAAPMDAVTKRTIICDS